MKYSAQAIVIDENGKLYLEDNNVTKMFSFIGWKREEGETYIMTLIREVKEELGFIFPESRFLDGQEQPIRLFWNAREEKYIEWKSCYFVLILTSDEVKNIRQNVKLHVIDNIIDLEKIPEERFWPLGREVLRAQMKRALSYL